MPLEYLVTLCYHITEMLKENRIYRVHVITLNKQVK